MILSDRDIRNRVAAASVEGFDGYPLVIDPFTEGVSGNGVISYGLTSAGYDLRLGPDVMVFKEEGGDFIDPKAFWNEHYRRRILQAEEGLEPGTRVILPPHSYALGVSLERLAIPRDLKGNCVGKSTYARCGIIVNTTPLEPGWCGHLTIEIANGTGRPAVVYVGEGICQLEFEQLSSRPDVTYADKQGKYQGQQGVTVARVL